MQRWQGCTEQPTSNSAWPFAPACNCSCALCSVAQHAPGAQGKLRLRLELHPDQEIASPHNMQGHFDDDMTFSTLARHGCLFAQEAPRLWQLVPLRWLHSTAAYQDKILLQGLVFHGYHGVYPEENKLGQKFVVDATLEADLMVAGQTDDLARTVNYAQVYEDIKAIVEGPPAQLIESVAERIAERILAGHPLVTAVRVGVRKPHVAVSGVVQSLGVEVMRLRQH